MFRRLTIGFLAILVGAPAFAADSYKCTVISASGLDDDGELSSSNWTELHQGKEFVLDVATGRMIGEVTNSNARSEPEILDPGSDDQSLKVITVFGPNVYIDYLLVRVYHEGDTKPFIFVTGETVLSGTCTEY